MQYLVVVAFVILLLTWVNYINLSTAKSMDRSREVGLRKVLGSYRSSLIVQFLIESFVINGLAMSFAFIIIVFSTPYFIALGGTSPDYIIWTQSWFWMAVTVIILSGTFLSGLYPAFVLSSFKPSSILHGKLKTSSRGIYLRKSLVIFQFAVSVAMIIGTIIVFNQMDYMQSRNLGFDLSQILVIERPAKIDSAATNKRNQVNSFYDNLKKRSEIVSVTGSDLLPGKKLRWKSPVRPTNQSADTEVSLNVTGVDYDFAEIMNMELVAGRTFSKDFQDEFDEVVLITANAVRALGYDSPEQALKQKIWVEHFGASERPSGEVTIIGVLDNYHQENLKVEQPKNLVYFSGYDSEYYMIKIQPGNLHNTLTAIEEQWYKSFPGNPFQSFFLDEYFNSYYEVERQFRDLFSVFSVLAVIIGCLGLFGLSSFTAMQRSKEIAIRKVLGSSLYSIVQLLSKEFLILVGSATVLIWPISYFLMDNWLDNYPYRIDIGLGPFIYSGVIVLVISCLTMSYQTFKSASSNPVDALYRD